MAVGPLSERVIRLCEAVYPQLSASGKAAVDDVRNRLSEPLRVAIAGRLKAGKSTLVNAFIGRRVAPTEVGECTRVVTQFRYGTSDRVDVVHRDGTRSVLPLDSAGMIPATLGVPLDTVAYLDVTLTLDRLRDLTVIDTPGLSSTNEQVSAGAEELLLAPVDENLDSRSLSAVSGAEAVAYVFTQAIREDDVAALEAFRSLSARLASTPINSLGVFSKVDKITGGGDPWPVVEPLAIEQARILRRQVSDVVPVVGLLAETIEAGRLTTAHCEALRQLSELSEEDRTVLLASVDLFVEHDCPVDRATRAELLDLLDLYGVAFSIAMLRADRGLSATGLIKRLGQASGFARAHYLLDRTFRVRADAIKAGWGLAVLERIAEKGGNPGESEALREELEQLMAEPEYHHLLVVEAAQQVSVGNVELPERMERELIRLALSSDPGRILNLPGAQTGNLIAGATAAAIRWRMFAVSEATPAQARIAHIAHRGFFLLSQQLKSYAG